MHCSIAQHPACTRSRLLGPCFKTGREQPCFTGHQAPTTSAGSKCHRMRITLSLGEGPKPGDFESGSSPSGLPTPHGTRRVGAKSSRTGRINASGSDHTVTFVPGPDRQVCTTADCWETSYVPGEGHMLSRRSWAGPGAPNTRRSELHPRVPDGHAPP